MAAELALLFCVVSGTEWARAAITVETLRAVAIKGLIERDGAARLTLTKQNKGAPCAARSISIAARVALFSRPLTLPE